VKDLISRGSLEASDEVWMLEGGCGNGKFAGNFLRALALVDADLYGRTRYVMSDYSEKNLGEVVADPQLARLIDEGRIVPAIFDMNNPQRIMLRDGGTLTHALAFFVSSYVSCVLPMKHLQLRSDGGWHELLVEVRAELDSEENATEHFIAEIVADATRYNLLKNMELHFDWGAVTLSEIFEHPSHTAVVEKIVEGMENATVGYPYGYIDFMRELSPLMLDGAVILTNDYGSVSQARIEGRFERRPQMYGNSLAQDINFIVFDAMSEVLDWKLLRTSSALDSVHAAAVCIAGFGPEARATFASHFCKRRPADDLLDYAAAAKGYVQKKDFNRALRFYQRCTELDPNDPQLCYRAGEAALDAGHHAIAVAHFETGYSLDVGMAWDFDFQLGRAHSLAGDHDEALAWYDKSHKREEHPVTLTNMGVLHAYHGRYAIAYKYYHRARELDPQYDRARDRLDRLKDLVWEDAVKAFESETETATEGENLNSATP
jgi:tetratricopeptide (TPR) repeat protein